MPFAASVLPAPISSSEVRKSDTRQRLNANYAPAQALGEGVGCIRNLVVHAMGHDLQSSRRK